jgi:hypothetical protein
MQADVVACEPLATAADPPWTNAAPAATASAATIPAAARRLNGVCISSSFLSPALPDC